MKKLFYAMIIFGGLLLATKGLSILDNNEYQKAISRCGSQENVITNYTNQGDKYYTCQK